MSRSEDKLFEFCASVRRHIDARAQEQDMTPDFADVVARADAPQWSARRLTSVPVETATAGLERAANSPDERLREFLSGVREVVEQRAATHRPHGEFRVRKGLRWSIAGVALGVAAAAIVVVVGAVELVRSKQESVPEAAQMVVAPDRSQENLLPQPSAPSIASIPAPATMPSDGDVEVEPTLPETVATSDAAASSMRPARRLQDTAASRDDLRAKIRELDDRAQRAWRAGEVGRAEELFEEIVRLAVRDPFVELAWSDLFAIAHAHHGDAKRLTQWKRYLRRFPRGRFADDARAGLCRIGHHDPARCWAQYLRDFPAGSFRAEAERHDGEGEGERR
jgi:hypothetical protein